MMWISVAKKIISFNYSNKILNFLALGVLISNIKNSQIKPIYITINSSHQLKFENYPELRKHQKWEMN